MKKWILQHFDDEATEELTAFFADEDVRDEIKRILKILARQDDPRRPAPSSGLIVDRLKHDAPEWFRVKVPRYALRIIFRLLVVRNQRLIELSAQDSFQPDEEGFVDITRVGRHPDVYGKGLRERYHKLHGKR